MQGRWNRSRTRELSGRRIICDKFTCQACVLAGLLGWCAVVLASDAPALHQARIKDIASIEGIRDNQLVGYGIVVGLQGTGDSQQTSFPTQTLAATLLRMGVSVPASSIRVQNLAAVFVSATLPPFARPGTKLDITASSAGDARSLEGGLLLMTPLYGADERECKAAEPSQYGANSLWGYGGTRCSPGSGGQKSILAAAE